MPLEGPRSCATGTTEGSDTVNWTGATNIYTADTNYATASTFNGTPIYVFFYLRKSGGSWSTAKTVSTNLGTSFSYLAGGGTTDTWGLTLSYSDVNNSGLALGIRAYDDTTGFYTNYLVASNFGFALDYNVTVVGIVAEANMSRSTYTPRCDHVRLTAYFTYPDFNVSGVASSVGSCII